MGDCWLILSWEISLRPVRRCGEEGSAPDHSGDHSETQELPAAIRGGQELELEQEQERSRRRSEWDWVWRLLSVTESAQTDCDNCDNCEENNPATSLLLCQVGLASPLLSCSSLYPALTKLAAHLLLCYVTLITQGISLFHRFPDFSLRIPGIVFPILLKSFKEDIFLWYLFELCYEIF